MGRKLWKKEQLVVAQYSKRCDNREITLMEATMNFVAYFISLDLSADDDDTKTANASIKVGTVSHLVKGDLYPYRLGNTQPLIDAINAIDDTVHTFMDADAKAKITGDLTP